MEKSGNLTEHSPAAIFGALATLKASGVIYLRGESGENAFVIVKRGVVRHVSGEAGAGDAGLKTILGWKAGEFRFIEDLETKEEDFPPNISAALAAAVARVEEVAPARAAPKVPPLPLVPAGEAVRDVSQDSGEVLEQWAADNDFTGYGCLSEGGVFWGLFLFKDGSPVGGVAWDGKSFIKNRTLGEIYAGCGGRPREVTCWRLTPSQSSAVEAFFTGNLGIARMPGGALNVDEYLNWAAAVKITAVIIVAAGGEVGNIFLYEGRPVGAATSRARVIKNDLDDVLALLFSPGSEVEVYVARGKN